MLRTIACFALLAATFPALADCLPDIEGWIQIEAEVVSCKRVNAPAPEAGQLLRVKIRKPTASLEGCLPQGCAEEKSYAPYVQFLGNTRSVFFRASSGAKCKNISKNTPLKVAVVDQCCDTIPHRGLCKLPGPVVQLLRAEF